MSTTAETTTTAATTTTTRAAIAKTALTTATTTTTTRAATATKIIQMLLQALKFFFHLLCSGELFCAEVFCRKSQFRLSGDGGCRGRVRTSLEKF